LSRNHRSAKTAGTRAERAVADYLAARLNDPRIDRAPRHGALDRGDIAGVTAHGQPLVLEVKDTSRLELASWIGEAHREARNADALTGVIVSKRRGTTDPARWWVHMTLDDLAALIDGRRQLGYAAEIGQPAHTETSYAASLDDDQLAPALAAAPEPGYPAGYPELGG
jgi:hypothetical protein